MEEGDNRLFITLVPKVYNNVFLFLALTTLGTLFYQFRSLLTFNILFLQELINLEAKDKCGKTILHHVAERGILALWDVIADRKGFEANINYVNCQICISVLGHKTLK